MLVRPKSDFKRHLEGKGSRLSAAGTCLHVTCVVARDYFDQLVGSRQANICNEPLGQLQSRHANAQ